MIRLALTALLLAAPCIAAAATNPLPNPNWPRPAGRGEALLRSVSLKAHNRARADFGVAHLQWSEQLAGEASAYAAEMARTGIYRHDPTRGRRAKQGENLWRGPRGVFSYDIMVGLMVEEGRLFRPGVFPNVSRTGEWHDVGHYTQIIWPTTTEVGCGLASSATTDYFVCRYAPTGNKDGFMLSERGD
jgi:hypothetical protein